ncbi:Chondroitin synthase [Polystyrenella longa]|uniref:Chondroitin synthase n=1 Tax=Polystyrenella longa TaxID=2528007 RepID=A0A518CHZ1_9PLAN|nr:glycosyltransferase family 2 protein [Polystyrenella longa]QDU78831.1 Chondroitin synthase [Polystyrenella longa]
MCSVSFVIPSLNQEQYLRRCLDSCFAQQLDDFEIIVRDGESTDGSVAVLQEYGDSISWVSKKDGGQAAAINSGIAAAQGDIVAWINSDDYYATDNVLSQVVELFQTDPELDIVYGDGEFVDADGNRTVAFPSQPLNSMKTILLHPVSFVLQPAVFFRRELFLQVSGLKEDLHWALDYDLWLRLFPAAQKVYYLPRLLACGTVHADAKSVYGMLPQFRETWNLKWQYAPEYDLNWWDRSRLYWGHGKNHLYYLAVKAGLKNVT